MGLVLNLGWARLERVQLWLENELVGRLWAIVGRVRVVGVSIERILWACMKGVCCRWGDRPLGLVTVGGNRRLVGWRRPAFDTDETDLWVTLVGKKGLGCIASCWTPAKQVAVGGLEASVLAEDHIFALKNGDPSLELCLGSKCKQYVGPRRSRRKRRTEKVRGTARPELALDFTLVTLRESLVDLEEDQGGLGRERGG